MAELREPGDFEIIDVDNEIQQLTEVKEKSAADKKPGDTSTASSTDGSGAKLGDKVVTGAPKEFLTADDTTLSDLIVELFDMLQKWGCAFAYERTALTREQRQHLKQFWFEHEGRDQNNIPQPRATAYERWLMRKMVEQDNYEKVAVELSVNEKTKLKLALDRCLAENNTKVTPAGALAIALLTILIPRLIPIVANLLEREQPPVIEFSTSETNGKKAA